MDKHNSIPQLNEYITFLLNNVNSDGTFSEVHKDRIKEACGNISILINWNSFGMDHDGQVSKDFLDLLNEFRKTQNVLDLHVKENKSNIFHIPTFVLKADDVALTFSLNRRKFQ